MNLDARSGGPPEWWTRTFPGEVAALRELSRWTHEVCTAASVERELVRDLELCLQEVVANLILHGEAGRGDQPIRVSLSTGRAGVLARVEDFGCPFDPRQVPERPAPATLADLTVGGYGIQILRHLTHDLAYHREGDRNVLTFRVGPPDTPAKGGPIVAPL